MKSLTLLIAFALSINIANSTVINVSNSPNAPINPPHTVATLQAGIDAASDGDTLYLHGTNISYGDATVSNKDLVIIGAGFGNNLQNGTNAKSIIGTISFQNYNGIKNITLVGILMLEPKCGNDNNNTVNILTIERCGVRPDGSTNNFLRCNTLFFKQSVLGDQPNESTYFNPVVKANAYFSNSVLQGNFNGAYLSSSRFENNIFKKSGNYNIYYYGRIDGINGTSIFTNNIFFEQYGIFVSNCTFNNNIFETLGSLENSNTGAGNLFNTPAQMVAVGGKYSTMARADFSTAVDYKLTPESAGKNAGTDGKDIGIYGGTNPIPLELRINGVPALPRITQLTLKNMSVAPGGTLEIELKAEKVN